MRFGLVLGGGGYAGTAFHAGVLSALARCSIDPSAADVIVGTSAGAAAAALIGAGFPPQEYVSLILEERLSEAARTAMEGVGRPLPAPPPPLPKPWPAAPDLVARAIRHPGSLPLGVVLAALSPRGTVAVDSVSPGYGPRFHEWPDRRIWITAVDLRSGQRAVFGRTHTATVAQAVSASVAIPGYFAPVEIDAVPYVDGGAWSTNHADLLADEELELVVVSAPSSTTQPWALDAPNWVRTPVRRQLQREVSLLRASGKRVVVLEPDRALRRVIGVNSMSLQRRKSVALATAAWALRRLQSAGLAAD